MDKDGRAICQVHGHVCLDIKRIRIGDSELSPTESRHRFFRRRRIVRTTINLSLISLILCSTLKHTVPLSWYISIPMYLLAAIVPLFFICIFMFPCIMTVYYLVKLLLYSETWRVHPQNSLHHRRRKCLSTRTAFGVKRYINHVVPVLL